MKRVLVGAACVLALAACSRKPATPPDAAAAGAAAPAHAAAPAALPERKAGLWEQKVSTAGTTQVSRICISDEVNRKVSIWGQQAGDDICTQTSLTPTIGGWKFASSCNMGSGGTIVSTGQTKGDFETHYIVDMKSSTTGAAAPHMNGEHLMTFEATWKGPCPAGFKPGDLELPGGTKINMLDIEP